MKIDYTIQIDPWTDHGVIPARAGRALMVFTHVSTMCGMAVLPVEDCPAGLLTSIAVHGVIPEADPTLEALKRQALADLLGKLRRAADLIPEIESMVSDNGPELFCGYADEVAL